MSKFTSMIDCIKRTACLPKSAAVLVCSYFGFYIGAATSSAVFDSCQNETSNDAYHACTDNLVKMCAVGGTLIAGSVSCGAFMLHYYCCKRKQEAQQNAVVVSESPPAMELDRLTTVGSSQATMPMRVV